MEKNLQNNFTAGKQFDFLLCCSPKEEFTPCVGFLPRWGWKGPFPSHGMCKRFHVEHAGCTSAEHSDWFDWDVSSKNIASRGGKLPCLPQEFPLINACLIPLLKPSAGKGNLPTPPLRGG